MTISKNYGTALNGKHILNLDNFAFPEAVFAYELER